MPASSVRKVWLWPLLEKGLSPTSTLELPKPCCPPKAEAGVADQRLPGSEGVFCLDHLVLQTEQGGMSSGFWPVL